MTAMKVTTFTSYALTDEETLAGSILTVGQKQVIQNLLAINAEEKVHLEFTPEQPLVFAQLEAYKRGQIELLQYILDASDSANAQLNHPN